MTIAVHIRFSGPKEDPSKNFNYRCFTILAGRFPEHPFIFIFDKPFNKALITQKNITAVLLSPQIKNKLLEHYWYNFKIPCLLNKYNADIFISDGINSSIRSTIKQCMILQDLSFLQKQNLYSRSDNRYLKKFFKKFIAKTDCIAVTDHHLGVALKKALPLATKKIHITGMGIPDGSGKTTYNDLQLIKDKYTEGKEYFICYITDVSASNTTTLLKAFSAFKKRQLSNMQLVLLISSSQKENAVKDLATYKYRNEVKLITTVEDTLTIELTAAAYAAIYLPGMEIIEDKGLLALKNNVPLITIGNEFCKSLYNDAALYVKTEEKNIAEKMMLLYKNENLRNDLANIGKQVGAIYTWDNTAANLWQALLHTTAQ